MAALITGGTGKTGSILAKLLHEANYPFVIASRSGKTTGAHRGVHFDWFDSNTFLNPFDADPGIDRVLLIPPTGTIAAVSVVGPFLDLAIKKGVKRFVLLASTEARVGSPGVGMIHQY